LKKVPRWRDRSMAKGIHLRIRGARAESLGFGQTRHAERSSGYGAKGETGVGGWVKKGAAKPRPGARLELERQTKHKTV